VGKKPDALQGTLDLLILKILSRGPQHGYGIAASIEAVSVAGQAVRLLGASSCLHDGNVLH